jgi:hypothetical protein
MKNSSTSSYFVIVIFLFGCWIFILKSKKTPKKQISYPQSIVISQNDSSKIAMTNKLVADKIDSLFLLEKTREEILAYLKTQLSKDDFESRKRAIDDRIHLLDSVKNQYIDESVNQALKDDLANPNSNVFRSIQEDFEEYVIEKIKKDADWDGYSIQKKTKILDGCKLLFIKKYNKILKFSDVEARKLIGRIIEEPSKKMLEKLP